MEREICCHASKHIHAYTQHTLCFFTSTALHTFDEYRASEYAETASLYLPRRYRSLPLVRLCVHKMSSTGQQNSISRI